MMDDERSTLPWEVGMINDKGRFTAFACLSSLILRSCPRERAR